jgi:TRAP-type transport system periplasmic protein
VHKFHKFHTLTSHFYISRPVFINRTAFDAWPQDLQRAVRAAVADAVAFQRKLALEEHAQSRRIIEDAGCQIVELTAAEHATFVDAVQPLLADARKMYGAEMFNLLPPA